MNIIAIIRASVLYEVTQTLRRWGNHSALAGIVADKRVQQSLIGLLLLISIINVLQTRMNAAMKFLSFLLLFVLVAVLTRSLSKPPSE